MGLWSYFCVEKLHINYSSRGNNFKHNTPHNNANPFVSQCYRNRTIREFKVWRIRSHLKFRVGCNRLARRAISRAWIGARIILWHEDLESRLIQEFAGIAYRIIMTLDNGKVVTAMSVNAGAYASSQRHSGWFGNPLNPILPPYRKPGTCRLKRC